MVITGSYNLGSLTTQINESRDLLVYMPIGSSSLCFPALVFSCSAARSALAISHPHKQHQQRSTEHDADESLLEQLVVLLILTPCDGEEIHPSSPWLALESSRLTAGRKRTNECPSLVSLN